MQEWNEFEDEFEEKCGGQRMKSLLTRGGRRQNKTSKQVSASHNHSNDFFDRYLCWTRTPFTIAVLVISVCLAALKKLTRKDTRFSSERWCAAQPCVFLKKIELEELEPMQCQLRSS